MALFFFLQNLEINPQTCDAYGHMMSRASEAAAAAAAAAEEITPPSSSRPSSVHPHYSPGRDLNPGRRDSYDASSDVIKDHSTIGSDKKNAQYLTSNCCEVKYYEGDPESAVEEHFSRALNKSNDIGKEKMLKVTLQIFKGSYINHVDS